jgi:hypothetical protein
VELRELARTPHPAYVEPIDFDGDGVRDFLVGDLGSFLPSDHDRGAVVWLRNTVWRTWRESTVRAPSISTGTATSISSLSSVSSGIPVYLVFSGPAGSQDAAQAYFGTGDRIIISRSNQFVRGGIAPVFTCDPSTGNTKHGELMFDINCIGFPTFGQDGDVTTPHDLRSPLRQNHDITLFKNFAIRGDQKLQVRVGIFNIFNQAFAFPVGDNTTDVTLALNTVCNRTVDNVPNGVGGTVSGVCDPTAGFSLTQDTINNFGRINTLRGHRVVEFAQKYYF